MGYYFAPLHYTSGEIIIDGHKITGMDPDEIRRSILGTQIAYIPQSAMNALNPTQKVISILEDVIHVHQPDATKKKFLNWPKNALESWGFQAEVLQNTRWNFRAA